MLLPFNKIRCRWSMINSIVILEFWAELQSKIIHKSQSHWYLRAQGWTKLSQRQKPRTHEPKIKSEKERFRMSKSRPHLRKALLKNKNIMHRVHKNSTVNFRHLIDSIRWTMVPLITLLHNTKGAKINITIYLTCNSTPSWNNVHNFANACICN